MINTNLPTLQVLEAARERIANKGNWTQDVRWGDLDTAGEFPRNCALGAIEFAYGARDWLHFNIFPFDKNEAVLALAVAARELQPGISNPWGDHEVGIVAYFNNTMGHERTLAMFDLAIATEKDRVRMRTIEKGSRIRGEGVCARLKRIAIPQ